MEVIIGSYYDGKVYSLNALDGQVKWSYTTGATSLCSTPAVGIDIKGNDTTLVYIGSNKLYCLNGVTGNVRWSYSGGFANSSPALADVNNDDTLEVFSGIISYACCFNAATGQLKWSYLTDAAVTSSPAVADLDGNDTLEVLFGNQSGKLKCFNGITGAVKWSYTALSGNIHRGISVADLNMDNKLEVLVPNMNGFRLVCLSGEDGTILWQKDLHDDIHDITIADIDNDGCVELVLGTYGGNSIWALDDIMNATNCGCMGAEEKLNVKNSMSKLKIVRNKIFLAVTNSEDVELKLYDLCGRIKETIYEGVLNKGTYTFTPKTKTSGIYFAKFSADNYKETKKLLLMK